ncbi:Beta-etherase [Pigmentiphaga humi]|uniref:Beta-etherase n=1 Tax=Pigmentiphaga humi TaxID=2478468 RepID=A0A3P4AYA4_9BURK|nr:glutathione S-transferase family protein [Pigmentiphaga humi]VCU69054.1 Beta-etherase [Pigmentiphaga humi]
MNRVLYDLAGANPDFRFSPYCWRARLALAHKGLAVQTVPWRFKEKDKLAFSGQGRVPVLVDGDNVVADSWRIAVYLEDAYPDAPALFAGPQARSLARFVNGWADSVQLAGLSRLVLADIPAALHADDLSYFQTSREQRFGMPLAAICADREQRVESFRASLFPLRQALADQPFLCGHAPAYADYIAFGGFQWARCVSDFPVLAHDDIIAQWLERMLEAAGPAARGMPALRCA